MTHLQNNLLMKMVKNVQSLVYY